MLEYTQNPLNDKEKDFVNCTFIYIYIFSHHIFKLNTILFIIHRSYFNIRYTSRTNLLFTKNCKNTKRIRLFFSMDVENRLKYYNELATRDFAIYIVLSTLYYTITNF